MKLLIKLFYIVLLTIFFVACGDDNTNVVSDTTIKTRICPQCNMPLPEHNLHTADINDNGDMVYFDDIGCTILWAKDKNIDLKKVKIRIYSNDEKSYIDPYEAYFAINERTPMLYGFSAYKKKCENCISFDEVIIKMLRGEHMANPKIRKQILGY